MIKKKVFISHASADYRDADGHIIPGNAISEIIKVLDDNHIERWIDESGLISSKGWCQQIEDAINECNIFLFISMPANLRPYINLLYDKPFNLAAALIRAIHNCLN